MRRILTASGRISSQISSHRLRPPPRAGAGKAGLRGCRQLLTRNPTGRATRIFSHAEASRLRGRRNPRRRSSRQEQITTDNHRDDDLAVPRPPSGEEYNVPPPTWKSPADEVEYRQNFYWTLENGHPNQMMDTLVDPRSARLVGSLAQPVFVEALHLLSPAHFVEPYRDLHHPLHSWTAATRGIKRVEAIFDDFVKNLLTIVSYRTAAGNSLQLAEYTHLLDCARSMGNGPWAEQIWTAMQADGVTPDAACYNHYMESKVWDHCYTGEEAYRLRMLPFHYRKRRMMDPSRGWHGYGTGGRSVRKVVLEIFRDMNEDGHPGDERTFTNMIIASSRVGHVNGIKSLLKTVWNVDVDALQTERDHSQLPPVTPYEPWSALYPTERLLFTVAHALGTNNDIAGALRAVDFISSSYKIPIPDKVWYELFERAFVLARRHSRRLEEQAKLGQVSRDFVRALFKAMTSEPYNVRPTLQIYRCMVRLNIADGQLEPCRDLLRAAYRLLSETREKRQKARTMVMECLSPALDGMVRQLQDGAVRPHPSLFRSPLLAEAVQAYDLMRLEVFQQTLLLQRAAFAAVVLTKEWQDTPVEVWDRRDRPQLLEEWRDFLPECKWFPHASGSGLVVFEGRTRRNNWSLVRDGRIQVRRTTDQKGLFSPTEDRIIDDGRHWQLQLKKYPQLDPSVAPLSRLFSFQKRYSKEFSELLGKLQTWVDYPPDHPLSTEKNPAGGFYGRLAALGLLKPTSREIFLMNEQP